MNKKQLIEHFKEQVELVPPTIVVTQTNFHGHYEDVKVSNSDAQIRALEIYAALIKELK